MSAYEDSYKSQLQGVSQQVARERLDGQVTEQTNMLSDAVTNLRRRPGAEHAFTLLAEAGATSDDYVAWDTTVGSVPCQVIINTREGSLYVMGDDGAPLYSAQSNYLKATKLAPSIDYAVVGSSLMLLNLERKPVLGPAQSTVYPNPLAAGFFYIRAGAFQKAYTVTATYKNPPGDTLTATATITTPQGTTGGDAGQATTDAIATALAAALNAGTAQHGVMAYRSGSFVFLSAPSAATQLRVFSEAGLSYIVCSNAGQIRQESDLPATLPPEAEGYLLTLGDSNNKRYYRYEAVSSTWLESGEYSSPRWLENCPLTLSYGAGGWVLDSQNFEGRFAGDADTNPDPEFLSAGITGISSYQGRLVLLAGNIVCMSASNNTRRFYRSTVVSLLDSDPIGIGSSAASGASYRYAVPYMKDLVLFADKVQAVIPGSNSALTPRTATVLPVSSYACDLRMRPMEVGRGLMFSAPRSAGFFGLMEMLPSSTVESQYESADVTPHLPTYMPGRCRFAVTSSVSSTAVFAPTGNRKVLIVHEYIWSGNEKVQSSWHRWEFPREVAAACFRGDSVVVLFLGGDQVLASTIQPKGGRNGAAVTYLDFNTQVDTVDGVLQMPAWLPNLLPEPEARAAIKAVNAEGPLEGEEVGLTYADGKWTTVRSFKGGKLRVGLPYRSSVTPTAPMRKDYQGVKISTNKMTVLRFVVSTLRSAPFDVTVADGDITYEDEYSPVFYYSQELSLGAPIEGGDSAVIVPARTRAELTDLTISTDGVGELNLVGLEFVAKYHSKLGRSK